MRCLEKRCSVKKLFLLLMVVVCCISGCNKNDDNKESTAGKNDTGISAADRQTSMFTASDELKVGKHTI